MVRVGRSVFSRAVRWGVSRVPTAESAVHKVKGSAEAIGIGDCKWHNLHLREAIDFLVVGKNRNQRRRGFKRHRASRRAHAVGCRHGHPTTMGPHVKKCVSDRQMVIDPTNDVRFGRFGKCKSWLGPSDTLPKSTRKGEAHFTPEPRTKHTFQRLMETWILALPTKLVADKHLRLSVFVRCP
jgi:hypothetical protein